MTLWVLVLFLNLNLYLLTLNDISTRTTRKKKYAKYLY